MREVAGDRYPALVNAVITRQYPARLMPAIAIAIAELTRPAIRDQIRPRCDGAPAQRHAVHAAIKDLVGNDDASAV